MENFNSGYSLQGTTSRVNQLAHISLVDGKFNTSVGLNTEYARGSNNTVVGAFASSGSDDRSRNIVVIGTRCAQRLQHSTYSVAVGTKAAYSAQAMHYSVMLGSGSGQYMQGAYHCTAVGYAAGAYMVGGLRNTFVGAHCGMYALDTADNTFVGESAGVACRDGVKNVCIGVSTGQGSNLGSNNVLIGFNAGGNIHGCEDNVAIGAMAMRNAVGNTNMCVGARTGINLTGSYNTMLGGSTCTDTTSEYTTVVGNYMLNDRDGNVVHVQNCVVVGQNIGVRPGTKPLRNMVVIGSNFELGNEHDESFLVRFGATTYMFGSRQGNSFTINYGQVQSIQPQFVNTEGVRATSNMTSPIYYVANAFANASITADADDMFLLAQSTGNVVLQPAAASSTYYVGNLGSVTTNVELNSLVLRGPVGGNVCLTPSAFSATYNLPGGSSLTSNVDLVLVPPPGGNVSTESVSCNVVYLPNNASVTANTDLFLTAPPGGNVCADFIKCQALYLANSASIAANADLVLQSNVAISGKMTVNGPASFDGLINSTGVAGPVLRQLTWDATANTHTLTWQALTGNADAAVGTLHVFASSRASDDKAAFAMVSVLKTPGRDPDMAIMSQHKSANTRTFQLQTANANVVVLTDAQCSVCSTFIGAL